MTIAFRHIATPNGADGSWCGWNVNITGGPPNQTITLIDHGQDREHELSRVHAGCGARCDWQRELQPTKDRAGQICRRYHRGRLEQLDHGRAGRFLPGLLVHFTRPNERAMPGSAEFRGPWSSLTFEGRARWGTLPSTAGQGRAGQCRPRQVQSDLSADLVMEDATTRCSEEVRSVGRDDRLRFWTCNRPGLEGLGLLLLTGGSDD